MRIYGNPKGQISGTPVHLVPTVEPPPLYLTDHLLVPKPKLGDTLSMTPDLYRFHSYEYTIIIF